MNSYDAYAQINPLKLKKNTTTTFTGEYKI